MYQYSTGTFTFAHQFLIAFSCILRWLHEPILSATEVCNIAYWSARRFIGTFTLSYLRDELRYMSRISSIFTPNLYKKSLIVVYREDFISME